MSKSRKFLLYIILLFFLAVSFFAGGGYFSICSGVSVAAFETDRNGVSVYDVTLDPSSCNDHEIYFTAPINQIEVDGWNTVLLGCNSDGSQLNAFSVIVDGNPCQGYLTKIGDTEYYFDFYGNSGKTVIAQVGTTLAVNGYFVFNNIVIKFNPAEFICTAVSDEEVGSTGKYYAVWEQLEVPDIAVQYGGDDCGLVINVVPGTASDLLSASSDSGEVEIEYSEGAVVDGRFVKENGSAFSEYTVTFTVEKNNGIKYAQTKILRVGFNDFMMKKGASVRLAEGSNGLRFAATFSSADYEIFGKENAYYGMIIVPKDYLTDGYELTYENFFGENAKFSAAEQTETGKRSFINIQTTPQICAEGYQITGSIVNVLVGNLTREFVGLAYVIDENGNYTFARYYNDDEAENTRSMYYVAQLAIDNDDSAEALQALYIDSYETYLENLGVNYTVTYRVNYILIGKETIQKTYEAKLNSIVTAVAPDFEDENYELVSESSLNSKIYANRETVFKFYYKSNKQDFEIAAFCIPVLSSENNYENQFNRSIAENLIEAGVNVVVYTGEGAGTCNTQDSVEKHKKIIRFFNSFGIKTIISLNGSYFSYDNIDSFFPDFTDCIDEGFIGLFIWDEPYVGEHDYGNGSVDAFAAIASYIAKFNAIYGAYNNVQFFTNLFPSYADSDVWESGGLNSYYEYIETYCTDILSSITNTSQRVLSLDTYPINRDYTLNDSFLYDLACLKIYAGAYSAKAKVGLQSSGWNEGNTAQSRMPTEEELRLQAYTALAFGIDDIFWFTYSAQSSLNQDGSMTPVQSNNTINPEAYNAFANVNNEINSFGSVYKEYDWKGVYYYSKSSSSWLNPQANAFKNLNSALTGLAGGRHKLSAADEIFTAVTSSQNFILGKFEKATDTQVYGYSVVNYSAPNKNITASVTFKTASDICLTIYKGGEYEVVTVTSAGYTLTLAPGEGAFITTEIPETVTYIVEYLNENGDSLQRSVVQAGSVVPVYEGSTPVKAETAQYSYVFIGWDKPIEGMVTGNITFTAQYAEAVRKYDVSLFNADRDNEEIAYGNLPDAPVREGYVFAGWQYEDGTPCNAVIDGRALVAKWKIYAPISARNVTIIEGLTEQLISSVVYESGRRTLTGAADNTYEFELPEINYKLYSEASCILYFGQANTGYTIKAYGVTFENVGTAWNWLKVIYVGPEGKAIKNNTETLSEGYYLAIGNTNIGEEWYTYVKLSDDVVNGKEGLKFSVTTNDGAWDWMKIRQDGSSEADNIAGRQIYEYIDSTACTLTEDSDFEELKNYLDRVADMTAYEKAHYEEPEIVKTLRAKYSGMTVTVIEGLTEQLISSAVYESGRRTLTGAADNTYEFELPEINYTLYSEASCILYFGQANTGYTIKAYGVTFENVGKAWNWLKVVYVGPEGKAIKNNTETLSEGYYLAIGNTAIGEEWYTYVKLSDDVINGKEGLKFSVTTNDGAWDWMKIRQDGKDGAPDNIAGKVGG